MKNYFYNKSSWTKVKSDVKQFVKYGLIDFTHHAKEQIVQRGFSEEQIKNILCEYSTEIVQYHAAGTYNSNKSDLVVFLAKYKNKKNVTKRVHIIVALEKNNNIPHYKIVTVYEPDKELFYASGRIVKPRPRV